MDWFKKHVDTVIVMGGILGSVLWMNHKFTEVDQRFSEVDKKFAKVDLKFAKVDLQFAKVDLQFAALEKDFAVMKAVMIVQGHMPKELAVQENGN